MYLYLYLYLYVYPHLYLYLYYLKVNAFLSAYSLLLHHFQEQPLDQATTGNHLTRQPPATTQPDNHRQPLNEYPGNHRQPQNHFMIPTTTTTTITAAITTLARKLRSATQKEPPRPQAGTLAQAG